MPQESEHFVCPCCGMHAPIERLTEEGPFVLAMFRKTLGGKLKLTEEQRIELIDGIHKESFRGSAPGKLEYEEIPVTDEIREAFRRRLEELI